MAMKEATTRIDSLTAGIGSAARLVRHTLASPRRFDRDESLGGSGRERSALWTEAVERFARAHELRQLQPVSEDLAVFVEAVLHLDRVVGLILIGETGDSRTIRLDGVILTRGDKPLSKGFFNDLGKATRTFSDVIERQVVPAFLRLDFVNIGEDDISTATDDILAERRERPGHWETSGLLR